MIKIIHEYLKYDLYTRIYMKVYINLFRQFSSLSFLDPDPALWGLIQIQVPIFLQGWIRNREHMGVGSETEVRFRLFFFNMIRGLSALIWILSPGSVYLPGREAGHHCRHRRRNRRCHYRGHCRTRRFRNRLGMRK